MSRELMPYENAIQTAKDRFQHIAAQTVNYDKECIFAMQALMKTDFAMKVANENPKSVHLAMINVASTGLTLNPANAYAYLVPRDGAIVLDISYKGLIKIATDSGAIVWARADVVYSADTFVYHGPASIPDHQADPFKSDRGEVIGAYCIAKTKDGDILTEVMSRADIEKVRDKSTAYVKAKKGPWVEFFTEMCRKAVIKRAQKTWPYGTDKLAQVIEVANESEGGYDFDSDEEREARRQIQHEAAVGRNWRSVAALKEQLEPEADERNGYAIAEIWAEVSREDQILLWRAPTKGGLVFTTEQRNWMKSSLPRPQQQEQAA
ncbi:MAG TPA: recombinase RecT [Rhodanobacteraceae bacterium]|nr:recombinase RecT [Rhodanobacteraceae bacterium]